MATKVGIISQAFILLGSKPVNDISSGNPIYAAVSALYDTILPSLLAEHPWRFATKLFALNQVNTTPIIPNWANVFQLPADVVRIYRTYPNAEYQIFGDQIYTNQSALTLEYVYQVDESTFPFYFERLMVVTLTAQCALVVTQNTSIKAVYDKDTAMQNSIAKFLDSQSSPNIPAQRDPVYDTHFF